MWNSLTLNHFLPANNAASSHESTGIVHSLKVIMKFMLKGAAGCFRTAGSWLCFSQYIPGTVRGLLIGNTGSTDVQFSYYMVPFIMRFQ